MGLSRLPVMFSLYGRSKPIPTKCANSSDNCRHPSTKLRQIVTPARAVLLHAARRGWCDAPTFEPIRQSPGRTQWLTPPQAEALVAAAAPHLKPLFVFLIATGARVSEALELEWPEVDLRHARATLVETKNGRDRFVSLPPRTIAALAPLLEREGRVFRPPRSEAYRDAGRAAGGQLKRGWAAACRRAGLAGISPHCLRHTWASWHYALHRDLLRLREDGCWSSVELVQRYAHLVPEGMAPEIRAWLGIGGPLAVVVGGNG